MMINDGLTKLGGSSLLFLLLLVLRHNDAAMLFGVLLLFFSFFLSLSWSMLSFVRWDRRICVYSIFRVFVGFGIGIIDTT